MYTMKQIVDSKSMIYDLPTSMYRMKNIYGTGTDANVPPSTTNGVNTDNASMNALQKRQTVIIQQLKELKGKLSTMHKTLLADVSTTKKPTNGDLKTSQRSGDLKPINLKYLQDVVVNVHPRSMPYCLIAFQHIWRDRLNLIVHCHTHSSIVSLPEINLYFAKQLQKIELNPLLPTLNVRLIWKEITSTELICVPASFVPILGEVNLVRYLSRVGPKEFAYGDADLVTSLDIDAVLDLTHQLLVAGSAKQRLAVLRQLSTKLGNQQFFSGNEFAACDIAVSSAFKQLPVSSKDIAPNLNDWVKRVTNIFGF